MKGVENKHVLSFLAACTVACLLASGLNLFLSEQARSPAYVVAIGVAIGAIKLLQPDNTFIGRVDWIGLAFVVLLVVASVVLFENPQIIGATADQVALGLCVVGAVVLLVRGAVLLRKWLRRGTGGAGR